MERLSTGLRNWILGYGSMREAFEDCLIKAYTGPAPASADDQATGVLLLTLTKSSGTVDTDKYNNGALSERSTHKTIQLTLDGDHGVGNTCKITINYNGAGAVSYTYTNTEDAGDGYAVRDMVARWLNRTFPYLKAIAGDVDDYYIYVRTTVAGDTLVIADDSGDITVTPDDCEVAARSNCLSFAPPSGGSMSKAAGETWSGEVQVSGVVGYFRIVQPEDDGSAYSASTPWIRGQGSAATSGAELGFSNTSLVDGDTHTVDTYSITLPAE